MRFSIPDEEIRFRVSRAGGPGGQHVNKASTRVEALWTVPESRAITEEQQARLLDKLQSRIDATGTIRVAAAARRSQAQNRAAAVERLRALVADALEEPPPRGTTRVPPASRAARLADKRKRSEVKRQRGPVEPDN